ncbi:MAG: TetR/AcrR family transcriptional regulator [Pseudomonadota bacterium]
MAPRSSGSSLSSTGKRRYHHGDLRNALIEAARTLIAELGPSGFTIAEAARAAGVSSAAPYRHFKDRDALLRAVALEGFERFAEVLEEAWDDPKLTPLEALDAQGRAYLAFARNEPAYFAAMFTPETAEADDPSLRRAADRAFMALLRAVEAVAATLPPEERPPALMMAHHIWAMSHGIASLFGDTGPQRGRGPASAADLLEAGVAVYLRGLGLLPR